MLDELALQKKITDATEKCGGHAFKCNNRFLIGVVDISMKCPHVPHAYNEVKLVKWPVKSATVQLELTRPQRCFLRDYRKAGGVSIYTVFGFSPAGWMIHIGHDLTLDKLPIACFDRCPPWVKPEAMVAMFEAYIMEQANNAA